MGSFGGNLTVTPKEIDELISNAARVIASGINQSLHVAINPG
ncbi:MAG: GPR endopeptidase [Bacillota bacterium]